MRTQPAKHHNLILPTLNLGALGADAQDVSAFRHSIACLYEVTLLLQVFGVGPSVVGTSRPTPRTVTIGSRYPQDAYN